MDAGEILTKTNPRKVYGPWVDGYVLDLHTSGSTYLGDNEFGHPQFETHRTDVGELLYRLKYRADEAAIEPLVQVAVDFILKWNPRPTLIVPVPATNTYRRIQPVPRLAGGLAAALNIPVALRAVKKRKQFAELKNVYDAEERRRLLAGAFTIDTPTVQKQRVLLLDDLYRSGATMNAITEALTVGGAEEVYAFAFTQTRSRT
jgi:predicted amidophosphoribosyltransferase